MAPGVRRRAAIRLQARPRRRSWLARQPLSPLRSHLHLHVRPELSSSLLYVPNSVPGALPLVR
jgi:hypothetical protein